jgi:hypothetical protein
MNARSRNTIATLLGSLAAAAALQAQAADITVVNWSVQETHPYFRSNCWNPAFNSAKADEWVDFGTIRGFQQFTWPAFEQLLDPRCKHPIVRYSYTLDGEDAPTGHGMRERTATLFFDATVPVYTLTITEVPELTSVTPARDMDRDDND